MHPSPPGGKPHRSSLLGAVAFAVLVLAVHAASFPYFEATRNANELPRIAQAMALVEDGTFAVDGAIARGLDLGPDLSRGPDGRLYPNKPPGVAVLGAAAYAVAKAVYGPDLTLRRATWAVRFATASLPLAILAFVLFRHWTGPAGVLAARARTALWAVLFASPLFAYGRLAYGHALAAACLAAGVALCAGAMVEGRPARALAGGFVAALAVTADYAAVFAAVPLGLVMVASLRPRAYFVAASALVGALVPMGALAAYHHAAFGAAFSTGYQAAVTPAFAAKHAVGVVGLSVPTWRGFVRHVLDPGFGLLVWYPAVVPAVVGLCALSVRPGPLREEARIHLGIVVALVLVICGLSFEGGWRVGPRYLVAALPGTALGLCWVLERIRARIVPIALVAAVFVYGWIVDGLAAALWPHFDPQAVRQPVAEVLLPLLRGGFAPYGVPEGPILVTAFVVLYGLFEFLPSVAWRDPGPPPSRFFGRRFAPGRVAPQDGRDAAGRNVLARALAIPGGADGRRILGAVAAGGLLAVAGVAALRLAAGHPRASANLAYVERVYEPPRSGAPPPSRHLP